MKYTPYGGAEVFLSRFVDELLKRGHTCHIFAAKWDETRTSHRFTNGHENNAARLSSPNASIGDMVLIKPDSRLRHAGTTELEVFSEQDSKLKTRDSKLIWHKVKTFGPSFLRLLSFALNACFAVQKVDLDVILSFDRTLYQDIYRAGDGCHKEWLIQRRKSGVRSQKSEVRRILKKIITFLNPLHFTILYLEKRLFKNKRLKFVIANSNRGKDEIKKHYGLPEEKFCVIYNGIDIKAFDLNERDRVRIACREKLNIKNETALLFVGSGFERKGLRFLIEALGILKKEGQNGGQSPSYKLVVVGKGQIRHYQNIADKCGVGMDVQFIGPVKDVREYYFAADIFVLPSIYEPFSNACLEAMASGLPVVTSRINGASEILTDGKDGMIVNNPANPEEIAEKIRPLLDERARQAAGKEARMTVENYTIGKNVSGFLRLIDEMKHNSTL